MDTVCALFWFVVFGVNSIHILLGALLLIWFHWGRVTHICVSKLTIIGSDNGCRLIGAKPLSEPMLKYWWLDQKKTIFSEILIETHTSSFKKIHLKMPSGKWRIFCLGLNVLILIPVWTSNHNHHKVWDEITYPFSKFNGATVDNGAPVEVWKWISYFIPQFTVHVITYPCWTPVTFHPWYLRGKQWGAL